MCENKLINSAKLDQFYDDINPLQMRSEALERKLTDAELSRCLSHLVKKRGYRGTRIEEQEAQIALKKDAAKKAKKPAKAKKEGEENDADKTKKIIYAISKFKEQLAASSSETLGDFLYKLNQEYDGCNQKSTKANYDEERFYDRGLYQDEFDLIKKRQREFGCAWDEGMWQTIEDFIFYQRPLKKPIMGKCILYNTCARAPRALPSFQRFRILQDLGNLKLWDGWNKEEIDPDEKRKIFDKLLRQNQMAFGKMRTLLKLPKERVFNLESARNKDLKGDKTSVLIAKHYGDEWYDLSLAMQDSIVMSLKYELDTDKLLLDLKNKNIPKDKIRALLQVPVSDLESGNACFSRKALRDLITYMEPQFTPAATIHRRLMPPKEVELKDKLDYYGKTLPNRVMNFFDKDDMNQEERMYGKIGNPTVHMALNQTRKIVNTIIDRFGKPEQIVVEVARDLKNSKRVKKLISSEMAANNKKNKSALEKIKKLGLRGTKLELARYRLWEELHPKEDKRCCVFTGKLIPLEKVFSSEVQIMKLLPFSKTLNSHTSNEILVWKKVVGLKGNATPDEAFNKEGSPFKYADILKRIKFLSQGKQFKFRPNALGKYGANISTHMNDNAYVSCVARDYLQSICQNVWTTSGELTPILKSSWGLDELSDINYDLRDIAVNAVVVGMIDRRLMKLANEKASSMDDLTFDQPKIDLVPRVSEIYEKLIVCPRPDRPYPTETHRQSYYTKIDEDKMPHDEDGNIKKTAFNLKIKKSIDSLTDGTISRIVSPKIRTVLGQVEWKDKKPQQDIRELLWKRLKIKPKSIKVFEKNQNWIELKFQDKKRGKEHHKVAVSGGNYGLWVWTLPYMEPTKEWLADRGLFCYRPTSDSDKLYIFQNRYNWDNNPPKPHPAAKKVMALHPTDLIKCKNKAGDKDVIAKVIAIDHTSKQIFAVPHNDGRGSKDRERIAVSYRKMSRGALEKVPFPKIV